MNEKKALAIYLIINFFSVLILGLYFYFMDNFMKNCCLFKICILGIFVLSLVLGISLLWAPKCNNYTEGDNCECEDSFVLIHTDKNTVTYTQSKKIQDLLIKARDGDILKINTDNFMIDSTMLTITNDNSTERKLILTIKEPGFIKISIK